MIAACELKSQTDALFSDAVVGTPLFATSSSSRLDGFLVGTQAGYNWQAGPWLFGVEADIQATNQHAGPTYVCPGAICNATITGVGTPVKGGMTYREAHLAMETICDSDALLSMEVVEVNPVIDEHNRTAILAVELVMSALGKRIL